MNRFIKIAIAFLVLILIVIGGYYLFLVNSNNQPKDDTTQGQNSLAEPEPATEMIIQGVVKCIPESKNLFGGNCEIFVEATDGGEYKLIDFDVKVEEGDKYEFTGFKDGISDDGYTKFTPNSYAKI